MSTQNERSAKAQIIWNSTDSNSITPIMVGSLFYDINVEKLEHDNSNAVYQTYDASYTKVAAINPTTKKMTLIDIPNGIGDLSNYYTKNETNLLLENYSKLGLKTTEELKNLVFDTDGYFDAGNIKPFSIETNMLSVGSRSQQLSLSSVFRINQDGNANKVDVRAGVLFSQTLDKTWNVSALVSTIPDNDYRYVYAKASKTTSTASIFLSKNQIPFDSDVNDYYFLVGILHSVVDGVRVLSITIGTTTISGGLVRTGIISSLDGLTSFNLNTGEIKGKITFLSSDGDYNDLDDTIKDVSSKVNYRVEITSTNGNLFKNDIIETTLIAKVYYGSEDITDSLPQNSFRWKRVSDDSTSDNAWNLLHQDFGSNILAISSIDVENRAVFNCEVNI